MERASMNAAAYLKAHVTSLEAQLSRAVDSCVRLRPADPAAYIGVRLISASAVAESPTTPQAATEAVASEPSAGAVASEWKAVSWLDSDWPRGQRPAFTHSCRRGRTAGANVSPESNECMATLHVACVALGAMPCVRMVFPPRARRKYTRAPCTGWLFRELRGDGI